jgi:signal transduction histidine kinase
MLVLLMAALVWSRTLRRQVNARTRDLRESEAEARALERRLLQAQKMESLGRLAGEPQNVSWNDVVGDTREMLQRLIGSRIGVHFDAQPGLWPVWLDPGQALQIVMNLVINARDAMPGAGTIAIEAANVSSGDRDHVRLSVRDDGAGMDAVTRGRIFEPFFTTKSSSRRRSWWSRTTRASASWPGSCSARSATRCWRPPMARARYAFIRRRPTVARKAIPVASIMI